MKHLLLPLTFLLSLSLNAEVAFKDQCIFTDENIAFNVSFPIQYDKKNAPQLFNMKCDLKTQKCEGVQIYLGSKISFSDVIIMTGAQITDKRDGIYEISWGNIRKFHLDSKSMKVRFIETAIGSNANVERSCKF